MVAVDMKYRIDHYETTFKVPYGRETREGALKLLKEFGTVLYDPARGWDPIEEGTIQDEQTKLWYGMGTYRKRRA